jgi:hypothetical protein
MDGVLFSAMFADTVRVCGLSWAHTYYCIKNGMPVWEFIIWRRSMLR